MSLVSGLLNAHFFGKMLTGFAGVFNTDSSSKSRVKVGCKCYLFVETADCLKFIGCVQVFVVGHDWGPIIGWDLCLFRPDRVKAYVAVSVPFRPRRPEGSLLQSCRDEYGDGFYMAKFQVCHLTLRRPHFFSTLKCGSLSICGQQHSTCCKSRADSLNTARPGPCELSSILNFTDSILPSFQKFAGETSST